MKRFDARRFMFRATPTALILLVLAQLIPIKKDNPPAEEELPMPVEVRSIIHRACYDCHSRETVWPWYSSVAPVSWLISHDVHEGREELDFTAWNRTEVEKRAKKLKEIREETGEDEMPPWYYVMMHPAAALSDRDHRILDEWAAGLGKKYSRIPDAPVDDKPVPHGTHTPDRIRIRKGGGDDE